MTIDPNNPVVRLCVQGMQAEARGRFDEARSLFARAWEASSDDFEACVAAHYLARHQNSLEDMLCWNHEALDRANAVQDARVLSFYPSLYLNIGFAYEMLENVPEARRYYDLAEGRLADLPEDPYGELVRHGIAEGRRRIGSAPVGYNGDSE
jgi:tetratricopeptide (TPR) repeat protein